MPNTELILALLIAVAALVTIARGIGIAYPIFLVIGGLLLGLVPGIPRIAFYVPLPPGRFDVEPGPVAMPKPEAWGALGPAGWRILKPQ